MGIIRKLPRLQGNPSIKTDLSKSSELSDPTVSDAREKHGESNSPLPKSLPLLLQLLPQLLALLLLQLPLPLQVCLQRATLLPTPPASLATPQPAWPVHP